MSRPLRINYENAYYHVMNRGRGRQLIFPTDAYYEDFMRGLNEAHQRFGIECHAYCLMSNHYHLLLKTPRANLSRAMRHIDGVYTQRHNRRRKTDGSLFRGRYKAIVIDADSSLLQVSRYIHRNPIELRKPLVQKLSDYVWSSYPAYLNFTQKPDWLYKDVVYEVLNSQQKYATYRRFVERGNDEETTHFYQRAHTPIVFGDATFKAAVRKKAAIDQEVAQKQWQEWVPVATVITQVARHFDIPEDGIRHAKRGKGQRNIARAIAMKLGQECSGATLNELAQTFNVGHYSTISQTIRRLNKIMAEDEEVETAYEIVCQKSCR